MSGRRKIRVPSSVQVVKWTTKETSRGIKHKQVAVSRNTPRSLPSTPSRNFMSPDVQQYHDGGDVEPLVLPTNRVSDMLTKTGVFNE
jgi:hypothetical protein